LNSIFYNDTRHPGSKAIRLLLGGPPVAVYSGFFFPIRRPPPDLIPWGDPEARVKPPRILPSVFVKYELPKNYANLKVSLEEGPDWCYKGFSVETLENGKPYLLSNVGGIKYLLSTGKYEIAKKVVLKLSWR
jgi:hypothetical protein